MATGAGGSTPFPAPFRHGMPNPDDTLRDPARLEALRRSRLLDSPAEEAFDRLTRLVCRLLGVPVALVSLVDAERQFFKSAIGLPQPWAFRRETPLSHSFCQHVVATGAPLVVQDARHCRLVCENLAVPELGVVAYLGMPLVTGDGQVLGSLCAIDTVPRTWSPADAAALADLAALAMSEVAVRRVSLLQTEARDRTGEPDAAARRERMRTGRLETLGRVAVGIVHDVANVLQAVQGGVTLAAERLDNDPTAARHLLGAVGGAAARGAAVTRRLLAFARPAGGPVLARLDLGSVFANLGEVLAPVLATPGLHLRLEPVPDLPPVLADRGELETVLVNLAVNARDAMPQGGTLTIAAAAEPGAGEAGLRAGAHVRLSVTDTGTGMTEEVLARAAEPFFTTKPPGEGTGLGLALAHELAEQTGGSLEISSTPGRGTTVTLRLPVALPGQG